MSWGCLQCDVVVSLSAAFPHTAPAVLELGRLTVATRLHSMVALSCSSCSELLQKAPFCPDASTLRKQRAHTLPALQRRRRGQLPSNLSQQAALLRLQRWLGGGGRRCCLVG